jgi:glycolate oxidase iron-sulfur subunit
MQTRFDAAQLSDPGTAAAAGAIRNCVHCGFCTATCPTYVLLGDELDSPRGRIYLIKEMLESSAAPSAAVVKHLDRCLSCLACETHCPSGVSYRRIIDEGRAYVEQHHRRPLRERLLRSLLAAVLPHRGRLRAALALARLARPFAARFEGSVTLRPLATLLRLDATAQTLRREHAQPPPGERPEARSAPASASAPQTQTRAAGAIRVGVAGGCVEPVLDPEIQRATIRLLERSGCEIVRPKHAGCCGALAHHMGREADSAQAMRAQIDAWHAELEAGDLAAIVVTTSGCGPVMRDYAHLLRDDPAYAGKAARISALVCDVTELYQRIELPPRVPRPPAVVAYHAACSLQHGQKVVGAPASLLTLAGFTVRAPRDAHLCCGSAGVYNILQPEIAGRLGLRKAASLDALRPDFIATGNIGCMVQIAGSSAIPVVHVAQLLDWATGGPKPHARAP